MGDLDLPPLDETENKLPPDAMTDVCHLLIRSYCKDTFDPFMVPGHPFGDEIEAIGRNCFYYSVFMARGLTMLLDNMGRGGMCNIEEDPVSAIWHTPTLLKELGVTFEELRDGTAKLMVDKAPPPNDELLAAFFPEEAAGLKV